MPPIQLPTMQMLIMTHTVMQTAPQMPVLNLPDMSPTIPTAMMAMTPNILLLLGMLMPTMTHMEIPTPPMFAKEEH